MSAASARARGFRLIAGAWLLFGATLLCLLVLDLLLRVVLGDSATPSVKPGAAMPARAQMAANGVRSASYWREHEQARHTAWRPYVYFRRLPFSGNQIAVDAHGFRHSAAAARTFGEVWFFGGSVVWGTGVSDAQTLPSLTALAWRGQAPRVLNFAESGYVTAQSHLSFAHALRCQGAMPRLAVFVDGVNDVYSALQSGRAGWPQNESNRAQEFNLSRRVDALALAWLTRLKGLSALRSRLAPSQLGWDAQRLEGLAGQIVDAYLATIAQTRAIAAARGVPVLFVWQPSLFAKTQRAPDEQSVLEASSSAHVALQLASDAELARRLLQAPQADIVDLQQVFQQHAEPLYLDFAHLGPAGNQLLIDALMPALYDRVGPSAEPVQAAACSERPLATSVSAAL